MAVFGRGRGKAFATGGTVTKLLFHNHFDLQIMNSWIKSCPRPRGTTSLWGWDVSSAYLVGNWVYFAKSLLGANLRLSQDSCCYKWWPSSLQDICSHATSGGLPLKSEEVKWGLKFATHSTEQGPSEWCQRPPLLWPRDDRHLVDGQSDWAEELHQYERHHSNEGPGSCCQPLASSREAHRGKYSLSVLICFMFSWGLWQLFLLFGHNV